MVLRHDLGDFSRRIRKVARNVESGVDKVVRAVAVAMNQALVLATPVDTGRARSNWQVSIETPITGQLERTSPQETLSENRSVIEGYEGGKVILIQNNVEYIGALNNGSSAQAPAGFVEKALQTAANQVSRSKVLQ